MKKSRQVLAATDKERRAGLISGSAVLLEQGPHQAPQQTGRVLTLLTSSSLFLESPKGQQQKYYILARITKHGQQDGRHGKAALTGIPRCIPRHNQAKPSP